MSPGDKIKRFLPRSLWARLFLWAGLIALVVAIGLGVDVFMGRRKVADALERIRARGEPISVGEIQFEQGVPPSDIQAKSKSFEELLDRAPDPSTDTDELSSTIDDPVTLPEWQPAVDVVKRFAACWKLEHAGPDRSSWANDVLGPYCDPRRKKEVTACDRLGIEALEALCEPMIADALDVCSMPRETGESIAHAWTPSSFHPPDAELRGPVNAVRVLRNSVPALLAKNDATAVTLRIRAMLHATRSTSGMPWLNAHYFCTTSLLQALQTCRIVTASDIRGIDWTGIERDLDEIDPRRELERALIGERAFGIDVFQSETQGSLDEFFSLFEHSSLFPLERLMNRSQDLALYLKAFDEGIAIARAPAWRLDPASQEWQRLKASFPDWAFCSKFLLPDFENDRDAATWMQADLALAHVAITAFRDGSQAGLDAASQSVDPFDDKPLRARIEPDVLVLWSIGPDLIDDGGMDEFPHPQPNGAFRMKKDDVWVVRVR
jgi:hypothetical protein